MMLQEHHHISQNGMQRNARMGMQQMGPPPNQRMLMSMPATGVLVSMPPGPGPTLITTTSIPQQPQQPKASMQQQVYHYENTGQPTEVDQHSTEHQNCSNTNTLSTPNSTLANIKEKTPMCLVNELARYNKIQHQYRLTGEQGPAHKKIFTVTLKLGNEEYEAEGPSIKKAQHSAAAQALAKTEFKHPPPKTVRNRPGNRPTNPGVVTPTVELNALAMKRGERTVYVVENGGAPPHQGYLSQPGYYPRHNLYNAQTQPQRYGYDARRNIRGHYPYHDNRYYGQFRPGAPHNPGDPFTVRLRVGEREYPGQGYTVQAARHDAASKAIEHIKQLGNQEQSEGTMSPDSTQQISNESVQQGSAVSDINSDLKSPISLVYEIALKRNLNVLFEVLSEKGPPHMKVFITQCRVGTFVAEGEGNGKKISKKRAAEKMLEELSKLPPLPNVINIAQLKRKRVTNKKKTRNLIKVNTDKSTEVVEEINPISRLIQIQQANKEREPVYTVLEERGTPRRREFVIEASVNGHSCTGVGPNKKVAKRNAAEALLMELGYNNTTNTNKPMIKDKDDVANMHSSMDKNRKVTFVEEVPEVQPTQSIGGSGGRQLVPGVLLVTEQAGFQKQKDNMEKPIQSQQPQIKSPSNIIQGVRSKDKLLYLAQLMNIQVQFSDFPKANHEMFLTLVSLSTNPPQVCHGEGPTTETSHEKAALEALKVLSELGLDIAPKDVSGGPAGNDSASPVVSNKGPVHQNGVKK
ncbi:double-stranded RNA-binding protein Staufen homolog 2-like isoform X1 [Diorhabda carinulata]|uniref:double-stranded RNA-binding protein Staufen homolog 2-like isoform X1 n=1 Tax=Diorhabda carinulata TaxID=1163345 RepID=UPI0025A01334|nr:double-stranded RNA-binding protein Staufen homolog 2-like isoform X1 [Diorhabda carinulata]